MPALWSEVPAGRADVYKAKLLAIADLLHPTTWASITSKGQLRNHFDSVVESIKDVVQEARYPWHEIVNCHSDDRHDKRHPDHRHHDE